MPISRRAFLGSATAATTLLSRCALKTCPVPPAPLPPGCRRDYVFRNWADTLSCRPSSYCQPGSESELGAVVEAAAAAGRQVRAVGGGHSFSPLVLTRDVLVNLDRMDSVLLADHDQGLVTVQAGIRLKQLIPALRALRRPGEARGLALPNLGSVTEQSIAGLCATATHGTGIGLSALSTRIERLKLVTGAGKVVEISDPHRLQAARVSLGALGIVTEVTLRVVPDYDLVGSYYWCHLEDVLPHLDTIVQENERVLLWWLVWRLGCRHSVVVHTMNPPGHPKGFLGQFEEAAKVPSMRLPADTRALARRQPRAAQPAWRLIGRRSGPYDRILTLPLLPVQHRECEYAVPADKAAEALQACRRLFEARELELLMPVEVRWVRRDDSLLSPARYGDVCYIGVSTRPNETPTEVFGPFEAAMRALGGRPHWGKVYSLTAQEVRGLYPDSYDGFLGVRDELDPGRVYANEHIRQLFG